MHVDGIMQKDKSITNFLKNIIFDQWRSAHARKLFCVKCLWGRSQPALSTTKFGASCIIINSSSGSLSVSLRKLCKVGNWRLIRIARISLTPPLNGFNCGAAGVQLARFENGWSIFSPKLAACGATSLFAWGVNRLHTHSMDLLINAHLKINRHLATLYGKITLFWFLLE